MNCTKNRTLVTCTLSNINILCSLHSVCYYFSYSSRPFLVVSICKRSGNKLSCWEHALYGAWDTNHLRNIQIHRYYWHEPHPSIVNIHVCVWEGDCLSPAICSWLAQPIANSGDFVLFLFCFHFLTLQPASSSFLHTQSLFSACSDSLQQCTCTFQALRLVDRGYRLPPPPGCPKAMYELMIQCW